MGFQKILAEVENMCNGDLSLMDDVAEYIHSYTCQARETENDYQLMIRGFNA